MADGGEGKDDVGDICGKLVTMLVPGDVMLVVARLPIDIASASAPIEDSVGDPVKGAGGGRGGMPH